VLLLLSDVSDVKTRQLSTSPATTDGRNAAPMVRSVLIGLPQSSMGPLADRLPCQAGSWLASQNSHSPASRPQSFQDSYHHTQPPRPTSAPLPPQSLVLVIRPIVLPYLLAEICNEERRNLESSRARFWVASRYDCISCLPSFRCLSRRVPRRGAVVPEVKHPVCFVEISGLS
jgi:hypothetical protein